ERLTKKEIQVALKGVTPLVTEQRLRWERELGEAVPLTLSEQEGNRIAKALQRWLAEHLETQPAEPFIVTSPEEWPDDVRRVAERVARESSEIELTDAFHRTCREAGVFVGELIRLRDPTRYWTIAPHKQFDGLNNLLSLCSTVKGRTAYHPTKMISGTMVQCHVWCDVAEPYKMGIASLIRGYVSR
ncbi:MAG: hypothetical protein HRU13_08905, partial [Phycisphaerales bacterium]|nr:hypothetical protein [Phycisphaerales bacterium]